MALALVFCSGTAAAERLRPTPCWPKLPSRLPTYRVVELSAPSGWFVTGEAVNNQGVIAGSVPTATGESRATVWVRGTAIDLGTLGGSTSVALDINNFGQVVGYSTTADGRVAPFIWVGGVMSEIPGVPNGEASGINDRGEVTGTAIEDTFRRAFLYDGATTRYLTGPTDPSRYNYAYAVNNRGQVVGWRSTPTTGQHAFVWEGGVLTELPSLGGNLDIAFDINDLGDIVGVSSDGTRQVAVYWKHGTVIDLQAGALLSDADSVAWSINNRREIVGQIQGPSADGSPLLAFYSRHGRTVTLDSLTPRGSWPMSVPRAINDCGEITGSGELTDWSNGVALLWSPY